MIEPRLFNLINENNIDATEEIKEVLSEGEEPENDKTTYFFKTINEIEDKNCSGYNLSFGLKEEVFSNLL